MSGKVKSTAMKSKTAKSKTKKAAPVGAAQKSVLRDASQHLMNTYKRSDMIFTHGRGCYVFDQAGKKYLDFLGGIAVNALGYSHPDLVKNLFPSAWNVDRQPVRSDHPGHRWTPGRPEPWDGDPDAEPGHRRRRNIDDAQQMQLHAAVVDGSECLVQGMFIERGAV